MTRPSSFSGPVKRCKHISRCKGERVARGTSKSRIQASTVNLMALSWTQVTGPTTRTGSSAQLPPSCRKLVWQKARARSILRQRSILACSTLRIDNEHLQTHAHARTHTHSLTRLYTHQQFEAGNASHDMQLSMISGTQTRTHITCPCDIHACRTGCIRIFVYIALPSGDSKSKGPPLGSIMM